MTPEDRARGLIVDVDDLYYPDETDLDGKIVAQAYLDLLKKWDGLDDPSIRIRTIFSDECIKIFNVMIKEAKK